MLLVDPDYTISANPVVASRKEGGKGGDVYNLIVLFQNNLS